MKQLLTKAKSFLTLTIFTVVLGTTAKAQVIVVATAATTGPTAYINLDAAFQAINAGTHQGTIGIGIVGNTTETGACVLNASGAGAAIYTSIQISPTTDGVTISGPTVAGRGLIELNGADNVTIDGDNPNTGGVNRNLTIQNTAGNAIARTSVIRLSTSSLITNCTNITIRNCSLTGSGTGRNISTVTTEVNTWGIIAAGGASTVAATTAPNALGSATGVAASGQVDANLIITNNSVQTCSRGIAIQGSANTVFPGLLISGNTVGNAVAGAVDQVWSIGITAQGSSNGIITGNSIYVEGFIESTTAGKGIDIGTISANGTFTIERNDIRRVQNNDQTTWPSVGVSIVGGTSHIIRNNFIAGLSNNMVAGTGAFSETWGVYGIRLAGGTAHMIYNNTVHMTGTIPGSTSTDITACLLITSTAVTGCDIRNNIFSNQMTGGNLAAQNMRHTCLLLPSGATSAMNLTINKNRYYQGGTAVSTIAQVGFTSGSSTDYFSVDFNAASTAPATNLRSYTSTLSAAGTNDDASIASVVAPPLTSATNLHANLAAGNILDISDVAVSLAGVTSDFDGDVRSGTPDIGGDEFISATCVGANGGTINPNTASACAGQTYAMSSTGATSGSGITYQWKVATVSGGPYSNVVGGSGATTTSYTTAVLTAGTYYYILQTTCSSGPVTGNSNELALTVNPPPSISVAPSSAVYCSGSSAIALTASGTSIGYLWSPPAGLSATVGASVNATPSSSTTYTVTGADMLGCTASATVAVAYGETPVMAPVTATPNPICVGDNTTITAMAGNTENYTLTAPAFVAEPCGVSAGPTGDDVVAQYPIGFTFNYFGASYTQLGISTNGNVQLGDGSGTTNNPGYSNAWADASIPNAAVPNNMIALCWDDWFINAGEITYTTSGSAPNRKMIICYNTTSRGSGSADTLIGQIVLVETSNEIYLNMTKKGIQVANTATQGIENQTGSAGVAVTGRQNQAWSALNNTQLFTPSGGSPSYAWSPATFLSATTGATVNANNMTASTTYSVVATTLTGCTASGSVTVTVNALPNVGLSGSSTICAGDSTLLTGSSGGTSQWYFNGVAIPGATTNTHYAGTAGIYNMTKTNLNGCTDSAAVGINIVVNALPTVTASATASTVCSGTMVTVNGGGAVSYSWSGGVTNNVPFSAIATTTYTVTGAAANGCMNTATVAVTVNALPTVVANVTATAVCPGTPVTFTGSGATSYTWTGGVNDGIPFTPSATNTYTVTGTDGNGCSAAAVTTVAVNAIPSVTANASVPAVCAGAQVTLTGGGAATYTWTGGVNDGIPFTPVMTDTYTVMGTDANGCSANATVTVTVNALPNVTAGVSDTLVCAGDSVTFTGAGAVSYTWDNGVTDGIPHATMSSNTYMVTGTDANGCVNTASVIVNVNALPNVTVALPLDTACLLLGPVTLGGESPVGGTWSGPGVTGNSFNPGAAGNGMHAIMYTYVDSLTGCSATAVDSMLVDICNDVDGMNGATIALYPNPNNGEFTLIPSGSGVVDVMIYSATGQLVHAQKANCGQINPIRMDASGIYTIVVVTSNGTRTAQRVIVNR